MLYIVLNFFLYLCTKYIMYNLNKKSYETCDNIALRQQNLPN
jgi:hypothetical protein